MFILLSLALYGDDVFVLQYSHKDAKCKLEKNDKIIPFFDEKFKRKAPRNPYTCYSIQKEQYKDCKVINKKNITAMSISYGSYDYTNAILSFKNINKHYDSQLKVQCSKKKFYDYSK